MCNICDIYMSKKQLKHTQCDIYKKWDGSSVHTAKTQTRGIFALQEGNTQIETRCTYIGRWDAILRMHVYVYE